MASTIRIKRSGTSGDPTTLGQGELAYSYLTDNGSNGGDRLYIGTGTEIAGNAVNHEVIGGKFFTQMLDHAKGTLTPNSAIIVDAESKIDQLKVDNITIDENSISVVGGLTFNTQGNAIDLGGVEIRGVATPTNDSDAANKAYVDSLAAEFVASAAADNGSFTFIPSTEFLTYTGGTGITTVADSDTNSITYNLENTAVTPGSYGSQTAIPTFTVDQQGRLTAASTVDVATNLTVNDDPISLLDSDLTFTATGNGLTLTYTPSTNTVDYAIDDATTSSKGVASFSDDDFTVASGVVTLDADIVKSFTTDSGSVSGSNHIITFIGNPIQGIYTEGTGSTITVAALNASYSQRGVAQFQSADFVLNNGDVSLDSSVIKQIMTDDGNVPIIGHMVSILGGEGINVNHAGTNISISGEEASSSNLGIASFDEEDFDVASGHVTLKSGSVENEDLVNNSITIGDTETELGATITDLTGLTSATIDTIRINGNKISTNYSTEVLILDPKGGDSNGGQVLVLGDLVVQGTQTIINSTTMSVNDLNIVLADSAADATAANGAGITVNGANATITYSVAGDKWNTNKDLDVGGEIYRNGVVLREYIEDHLGNNFFAAGEGLDITYGSSQDSDNTIIFAAEIATYSNRGVASFDSDQFSVSSGFVTVSELDGGTY
jgi:hypothetical protein